MDNPYACLYCPDGGSVRLIRKDTLFSCPQCATIWANIRETRQQLTQARRKLKEKQEKSK